MASIEAMRELVQLHDLGVVIPQNVLKLVAADDRAAAVKELQRLPIPTRSVFAAELRSRAINALTARP